MGKFEIFTSVLLLILSFGSFAIGYKQYKEKGFLLNNAYIYASKKERNEMNKTPYYKQSAKVLFIVGLIFLTNFVEILLQNELMTYLIILEVIILIVYAVTSTVAINRKERQL